MEHTILQGDALELLRTLPPESVHTCVTSPPYYGLRDYGADGQIGKEETPEDYIEKLLQVFREVRRVLCADGTLWVNIGDSYAGSGKGRMADGTHYEKKPSKSGNYGGIREGHLKKTEAAGCKPKDLIGIPWLLAFALRADGWYLRQDIIWAKQTVCRRVCATAARNRMSTSSCCQSQRTIISTRQQSANQSHRPKETQGRFAAAEPIPAVDLTTTAHRWSVRATGTVKTRRGAGTSGASGA